jgi:hypothetical protein
MLTIDEDFNQMNENIEISDEDEGFTISDFPNPREI